MSETVYLKDVESFSVAEATKDRERLSELNVRSPDVSKMYKLRIDKQTLMFFRDHGHRAIFIGKYYNRKTKRFSFEKRESQEETLY